MIARKQGISLQLNQLIDAMILGAVFWACHFLLSSKIVPPFSPEMPGFTHFLWMLAVIIPFGPFLLELQGFYHYQLEKSLRKSLGQTVRAGFWLIVIRGLGAHGSRIHRPLVALAGHPHPRENHPRRIGWSTCKINPANPLLAQPCASAFPATAAPF